jgi:hypothetical protein
VLINNFETNLADFIFQQGFCFLVIAEQACPAVRQLIKPIREM